MKDPKSPSPLSHLQTRLDRGSDATRTDAIAKRHARGFRSARENLEALVDRDSFVEYGQLAVAAQRNRRDLESLQRDTPGDGIITGTATVNADAFGPSATRTAIVINDYTVLAGTQGYFHHKKLDRLLDIAEREALPVIMYTEGGGGRPGDTDVTTTMAGLNVTTFWRWSKLTGKVPRVSVTNGFCFAGNAALFGAADVRIATQTSWIGMAGPAMIEGGGLGVYKPTDIGPADLHAHNGGIDLLVADEATATQAAKAVLAYTQGDAISFEADSQQSLRDILPENRRMAFDVRKIINRLFDRQSVTELRPAYGRAIITGFARVAGKAVAFIASDCRHLGGAIDTTAARKCDEFFRLVKRWQLPIVSLIDTPGFMVGPASEAEGAARVMPELFNSAAAIDMPWIAIFLRRGYGLGAMALAGGSFEAPTIAASWPDGEFGGMGLEGAVTLGYRKELEALAEGPEREALFDSLLAQLYAQGRATEAASFLELDMVIDPANTRAIILQGLQRGKTPTK